MNTTNVPSGSPQQPTKPADFSRLEGDGTATPKDEALAALESNLQSEKDARMEERFIWLVISVILVDVIWLRNSPNSTFPIVVLILELVALLVIARRMGVNDFVQLMDRILHGFGTRGSNG